MIFYDLLFTTSQTLTDDSLRHKINELLDKECADKDFTVQAYEVKNNLLRLVCCYTCATTEPQNISQVLAEHLQKLIHADVSIQTIEEITTSEFYQKVKTAEDFDPDFLDSAHFETQEYIFDKNVVQSKAMSESPVQYKITATSFEKAKKLVENVVNNSIHSNRIAGTRTTFVKLNIPRINTYFENEVEYFFERSIGTTVVIDLASIRFRKNLPKSVKDLSRELWNAFEKSILKYADHISFVFLETGEASPNSKEVLDRLAGKLEIVDITEDVSI